MDEYMRMTQKSADDLKSEMRPDVANRVRNSLVLEAFGEAEGVEVTDEDINAEIESMVGDSEQAEQMKELYQSDYFKNMLQSQLENRKITERLIEFVSGGTGAITGEGKQLLEEQSSSATVESTEIEGTSEDESSEEAASEGDESEQDQAAAATATADFEDDEKKADS